MRRKFFLLVGGVLIGVAAGWQSAVGLQSHPRGFFWLQVNPVRYFADQWVLPLLSLGCERVAGVFGAAEACESWAEALSVRGWPLAADLDGDGEADELCEQFVTDGGCTAWSASLAFDGVFDLRITPPPGHSLFGWVEATPKEKEAWEIRLGRLDGAVVNLKGRQALCSALVERPVAPLGYGFQVDDPPLQCEIRADGTEAWAHETRR
jgi:hypothetical protein